MSQLKTNSIVDASGGNTATINGVAPNVNNIRGKNKIINGNFDVWQRGTSGFTTNGAYAADRWVLGGGTASMALSQQSFTKGQTDVPSEPAYYLRSVSTTNSGASSAVIVTQKIEDVRTLSGQTATLSFWAKADSTKNIATEFVQSGGTGGSPTVITSIGVTTHALTTSWQKFEVTVSIPSISAFTTINNADSSLNVNFWLEAGSDYNARTNSLGNQSGTFDIAQVQLEAGDTASGFEHLSYGETLALCQRYYQQSFDDGQTSGASPTTVFRMSSLANGSGSHTIYFRERMRADPTIVIWGGITGTVGGPDDGSTIRVAVNLGATRDFAVFTWTGGNAYENLVANYTADAEL